MDTTVADYADCLMPLWALGAGFALVSIMADTKTESSARRLVLAVYADFPRAELAVTLLQREEFPMDRVSLLGQTSATGDDPIGVYYLRVGERIRGWGKQGAFWGALWGLFAGAAGMFLLPGIGPILAAGPLVDALVGAMAGAGVGGGVMAGAGAVAHLSSAIHRMGVPQEDLDGVVEEIEQGAHLVMLTVFSEYVEQWVETLALTKPKSLRDYPYVGLGTSNLKTGPIRRRCIPAGCVARRLQAAACALLAPCHPGASTTSWTSLTIGGPLVEAASSGSP